MNIGKPRIKPAVKLGGKLEELAPARSVSSVPEPDAQLALEKDMTDNASEYERGYQVGYNRAIELANMELAKRRSVRASGIHAGHGAPVPHGVLGLQDRHLR